MSWKFAGLSVSDEPKPENTPCVMCGLPGVLFRADAQFPDPADEDFALCPPCIVGTLGLAVEEARAVLEGHRSLPSRQETEENARETFSASEGGRITSGIDQ